MTCIEKIVFIERVLSLSLSLYTLGPGQQVHNRQLTGQTWYYRYRYICLRTTHPTHTVIFASNSLCENGIPWIYPSSVNLSVHHTSLRKKWYHNGTPGVLLLQMVPLFSKWHSFCANNVWRTDRRRVIHSTPIFTKWIRSNKSHLNATTTHHFFRKKAIEVTWTICMGNDLYGKSC